MNVVAPIFAGIDLVKASVTQRTSSEAGLRTINCLERAFHFLFLYSSFIAFIYAALYSIHSASMRYYEQKYPEVDELVMVQVRQIAEMGAYVKLVCYSIL